jgi:hypothetical protein
MEAELETEGQEEGEKLLEEREWVRVEQQEQERGEE